MVREDSLSPLRGSNFQYSQPTAGAVATISSLLRSYLLELSKTNLRPWDGEPGRALPGIADTCSAANARWL
ncbi:MAG: hypothetical protein DME21_03080 [Verrucomicrobia bacterium]|nr:MAG: hypothetical protein DME21_03080 [Verrucomicrobiota bacterium]